METTPALPALSSPIQLIKKAFEFYKSHFKIFVGLLALPLIFEMLLLVAGEVSYFFPKESKAGVIFYIGIALIGIVHAVVGVVASVALLRTVSDQNNGIPFPGVRIAYQHGIRLILPLLWVGIITALVYWGAFMFFVIPLLIVGIYLSASQFVVVEENERGVNALIRSWGYIKGRWGEVFWRYVFLGLIAFAVVIVGGIIAMTGYVPFVEPFIPIVETLSRYISTLFIQPMLVAYYYFLYRELKASKPEALLNNEAKKNKRWVTFFLAFGVVTILGVLALISYFFPLIT